MEKHQINLAVDAIFQLSQYTQSSMYDIFKILNDSGVFGESGENIKQVMMEKFGTERRI